MNRIAFLFLATSLVLLAIVSENYGLGGRGGFTSPVRGQSQISSFSGHSGVGPGGGTWQSGSRNESFTTNRGTTIDFRGAELGGTSRNGVSGGRYVGGVQVTGAGGQTATKVGTGGRISGPGGVTVGGRSSIGGTAGPLGSGFSASRSGFAVGPGGAVGVHTGIASTTHGTYYRSSTAFAGQGFRVRTAFTPYYSCFSRTWFAHYPGAWFAAGWVAGRPWSVATWSTISTACSYPAAPIYYDYGSSVVYQDNSVYVNGDIVGTAEAYSTWATSIAETGLKAQPAKDDEWNPLGVFAMTQGDEGTSNNIFQLAINKEGVIRGNYYNALTDTNEPVYGSVDKKTQRAAWTVGDKKKPVYEAGIANLTKDETTMMVHYDKDRSQQMTLFRIEKPADGEQK